MSKRENCIFKIVGDGITQQENKYPFEIFLCGPSLKSQKASALLRANLHCELKDKGFTVVLGEDEGIVNLTKRYELDAQSSEISYVNESDCRAIIIVADSVGTHCELGLFNWLYIYSDKHFKQDDIVFFRVILNEEYENDPSYLNKGPIDNLKGKAEIIYTDFRSFDVEELVKEFVVKRRLLAVNDGKQDG